jgi:hypothetical protein
MRRNIMKKISVLISFLIVFTISCNEVEFSTEHEITNSSFIEIKTDPPVVTPGESVEISVAADDGRGSLPAMNISAGNIVFAGKNKATLDIPADISALFGDEAAKELRNSGYVEVPIEVSMTQTALFAVKKLKIVKSDATPSNFWVNPSISKMEYEVVGSAQKIEIEKDATVYFNPSSIPGKVTIIPEKTVVDDLLKDEYEFVWYFSSSKNILPELADFDESTGEILINLKDETGAPMVGTFRFYAVLKAVKTFEGTDSPRYGSDFFTFEIDTDGE